MKNGDWRIDRSPSMTSEGKKVQHQRVRLAVIVALGGKCTRCPETDQRVLTVDHINGGGSAERKKYKGTSYYYHVLKTFSNGVYQLLCANCHIKKTWRGEVAS